MINDRWYSLPVSSNCCNSGERFNGSMAVHCCEWWLRVSSQRMIHSCLASNLLVSDGQKTVNNQQQLCFRDSFEVSLRIPGAISESDASLVKVTELRCFHFLQIQSAAPLEGCCGLTWWASTCASPKRSRAITLRLTKLIRLIRIGFPSTIG